MRTVIQNNQEFGQVSGVYFNVPLIFSSLLAGYLTEKYSRKILISGSTMAVSACVIGMGMSQ